MSYGKDVQRELRVPARELRQAIPGVYQGFAHLHEEALAAGALGAKAKELIALAIAVSKGCDGCIASHARGAAKAGATMEEAAEALGVVVLMDGGTATVHGPRAYAAFREYYDELNPAASAA